MLCSLLTVGSPRAPQLLAGVGMFGAHAGAAAAMAELDTLFTCAVSLVDAGAAPQDDRAAPARRLLPTPRFARAPQTVP
jgi:hypothetical protein